MMNKDLLILCVWIYYHYLHDHEEESNQFAQGVFKLRSRHAVSASLPRGRNLRRSARQWQGVGKGKGEGYIKYFQ